MAAEDYDVYFRKAIDLQERSAHAFQHARTLLCYGERLRRARRRRDARVQLRAAIEIFDRLDARPWADRARAEMSASGETSRRDGPAGERLTPQELQIALLVIQGQTNAEIGRALFLSTRTVEFHLSRAYRKLGISSRTGLDGNDLIVVEVWESKGDQEQFMSTRLGPAFQAGNVPPPRRVAWFSEVGSWRRN